MKKAYVASAVVEKPKMYDNIIWYKDKEWCIGSVIGEGCEGKTRVRVNKEKYETHTNTLKKLVLVEHAGRIVADLHPMDWKHAIEENIIDNMKSVEFTMGEEHYCSYPHSCECSTNVAIANCDQGYTKAIASITGIIDQDYSEMDMVQYAMYMAMNYQEVLNTENAFWYRKRLKDWLKTKKPKNFK